MSRPRTFTKEEAKQRNTDLAIKYKKIHCSQIQVQKKTKDKLLKLKSVDTWDQLLIKMLESHTNK